MQNCWKYIVAPSAPSCIYAVCRAFPVEHKLAPSHSTGYEPRAFLGSVVLWVPFPLSIMTVIPTTVFDGINTMKKLEAGGWHCWSMDIYTIWAQNSALGFAAIYLGLADSEKTQIDSLVDLVDRGSQAWFTLSCCHATNSTIAHVNIKKLAISLMPQSPTTIVKSLHVPTSYECQGTSEMWPVQLGFPIQKVRKLILNKVLV